MSSQWSYTLNLKLPRKSGKLERDIFKLLESQKVGKMEKVTLVDKEILIATVNGNYCAIGNNDRCADFLEIPIKEKGFVKVIEVYFLVLASRFFSFAFALNYNLCCCSIACQWGQRLFFCFVKRLLREESP